MPFGIFEVLIIGGFPPVILHSGLTSQQAFHTLTLDIIRYSHPRKIKQGWGDIYIKGQLL